MSSIERRTESRIDVRMPIRFRPITNPASAEQSAESLNISGHGLLFSTNCELRVGDPVEIYLRMPPELSPKPAQVRWSARVVHVEQGPASQKRGVGVRVETRALVAELDCDVC
jgi:c-di-GMP-binding flagellar brake protein YcgR